MLIKCPDCGREVSDRAATCPQCAAPIASVSSMPSPATPTAEPSHVCIHCSSADLVYSDDKQGFGVGKALAGAVVFGPLGLLAGGINKNKRSVFVRCGKCLKVFTADEMFAKEKRASNAHAAPTTNGKYKCQKCGARYDRFPRTCAACGQPMRAPAEGYVLLVMIIGLCAWGWHACGTNSNSSTSTPASSTSTP